MEENEGLPLIQFIRDYYMAEFGNYNLSEIAEDDKLALFTDAVMGKMFAIVLSFKEGSQNDSYLAGLINAETLASLKDLINLGYEQAK